MSTVCARDDEEIAYEIVEAIESIWEATGIEVCEKVACRQFCRMDLLPVVQEKMRLLKKLRKVMNYGSSNRKKR
jgi:hypothetical protein